MNLDVIVLNNLGGGISVLVDRMPSLGETVKGYSWKTNVDSGKGPNSCICMARLGIRPAFLGIAGQDPAGDRGEMWMQSAGVDTSALLRTAKFPTGQGIRIVDRNGQNMIVCGESVSHVLTKKEIVRELERLAPAAYFLTGFEISEALTLEGLKKAYSLGMKTILNYSPVPKERFSSLSCVDYLVLNEMEAAALSSSSSGTILNLKQAKNVALFLKQRYACKNIIITLGKTGCICLEEDLSYEEILAPTVSVLDTTGAGDAFISAMIARLVRGDKLTDACRWATVFASDTATRVGTIPSYPLLQDFLSSKLAKRYGLT